VCSEVRSIVVPTTGEESGFAGTGDSSVRCSRFHVNYAEVLVGLADGANMRMIYPDALLNFLRVIRFAKARACCVKWFHLVSAEGRLPNSGH
jgi:hypothetical protein